MIELKDISKVYPTKNGPLMAVRDVNLSIDRGEIFGIIGYSGAGKSTLIRMLNGLERPTEGVVTVGGMDVSHMSEKELRQARQKVSMIFQHFNLLWSRTVFDNIAFPLEIAGVPKAQRKARVLELIELVGLKGRESAYPSELSGGQKQRVGIARALANEPDVLLGDEATSALDPETTDAILDLLVDINQRLGITIVLITHEMHVIQKICHRVAVMEAGEVVETGPVLDVFRQPEAPITKRFVSQLAGTDDIDATYETIRANYPTGKLVKLVFVGERTEQAVVSEMAKRFDVSASVVHGTISQTTGGPYGTLVIHIDGTEMEEALRYVEGLDIETEVMNG